MDAMMRNMRLRLFQVIIVHAMFEMFSFAHEIIISSGLANGSHSPRCPKLCIVMKFTGTVVILL